MKLIQPRRFHPGKAAWLLFVLGAYFLYTTYRDRAPQYGSWSGDIFGSTYRVQFFAHRFTEPDAVQLRREVTALLASLDQSLSTWKPDSEISRFNAGTGTTPLAVGRDTAEITRMALAVSRLSAGAFDVTYAPVFKLWGFGTEGPGRIPSHEEIAATRTRCGWQHLQVTDEGHLQKDIPQLSFNLNAVAPGYAAEAIGRLLTAKGITNFYVDVGGEAVVRGGKAAGKPWVIGVEEPARDAEYGARLATGVALADGALATSGDYRNYFRGADGQYYSHIFDPRLGRPATSHVGSVSVIYTNGGWADALATTLFVMGPEEGIPWLTNLPGAEAYFILRDGTNLVTRMTTGFKDKLRPVR